MCPVSGMAVHNALQIQIKIHRNFFEIYQLGHFLSDKQMAPLSYSEGEYSFLLFISVFMV